MSARFAMQPGTGCDWPAATVRYPAGVEHVLVQRDFDAPVGYDTFHGAEARDPGCLSRHRVTYTGSLVALDGLRMICYARAPDAEAVLTPARINGVPFTHVFTADPHAEPGFESEPTPAALGRVVDGRDAEPYRRVTVVQRHAGERLDLATMLTAARELVGPGAVHLFSHLGRARDRYVGVFEHSHPQATSNGELVVWPAIVRTKKRGPDATPR